MNQFHPFLTIHLILSQIQRKNAAMEMTNLPMLKEVVTRVTTLKIVAKITSLKYLKDNELIKGEFMCHYFLGQVEFGHVWVKFNLNQVQGQKIKLLR